MDITHKPVIELADMLNKKTISSYELTSLYLERIKARDKLINSYITVTEELAVKAAKESDERRSRNKQLGVLDGIPYSLKDNIITSGVPTTCASKMLEAFIPDYDSTVYSRLKNSGAVLLGKTNMDEFAMGSSTVTSHFKTTLNPENLNYVAGGSSGGSAAAVADGLCGFSLGSDTGGSARQPASFCGVFGLCPTYGRISRFGLIPFASSLDRIAPIARSAEDLRCIMNVISGYDKKDETSSRREADFNSKSLTDFSELKIAVIEDMPSSDNSTEDVIKGFSEAVNYFKRKGSRLKAYSLSELKDAALTAYYIISSAEASSNLARYDGLNYGYSYDGCDSLDSMYKHTRSNGFGSEVKRRIMLGSFVLSAGYSDKYYKKALEIKKRITMALDEILRECDFILTPSTPVTAYTQAYAREAEIKFYADDIFSSFVNLAKLSAISVPFGKDSRSLPLGIQLIGKSFDEGKLIDAAGGIENGI